MLGPQAGDRNPMIIQPCDRGVVDRLVPTGIRNHGPADPPDAPCDQREESKHDQDRERDGDRNCHERGHAILQPVLERPYESDDENRERQRREYHLGLEGGDREAYRGEESRATSERECPTSLLEGLRKWDAGREAPREWLDLVRNSNTLTNRNGNERHVFPSREPRLRGR